jgi:cephalosporin hydroxylase
MYAVCPEVVHNLVSFAAASTDIRRSRTEKDRSNYICLIATNSYSEAMSKPDFRVKRYAHDKYKFLVRGKVDGKWKRRYFVMESEAIAFAEQQNAEAQKGNGDRASPRNGATPRPAESTSAARSTSTTDFAKLVAPTYLGPRIQRYLGDSWSMHLPFAYDLMREVAPKVFVELGVKHGESYFSFCQSAAENKINVRCYGVDSWQGDVQTGKLDPKIQDEVAAHNWQYSSFSELKVMFFAEALGDFPDASIDLLHIDGTHTYSEVKADFESWLPKLSSNGIVLFHDVIVRDRGFGVWKVWEEIAREDNSFLFEFGYGLGVWKRQPVAPSDSFFVRRLLGANKTERRDLNAYYANAAAALALWQGLQKQSAIENQVTRFKTEAEERTQQVVHFQRDAKEKSKHVIQLQGDLEEKSRQVTHFQREAEERSCQVAQFKAESEEKAKHVAQLQQDLQQKTTQVLHFQRESDQQAQRLERVRNQFDLAGERLTRAQNELLDARWEALTLRGTVLRGNNPAESSSFRLVELENRAETAASERDHLRAMLTALQNDFEHARVAAQAREGELRDQLKAAVKELRAAQKQMDRLRENISRKLILPFGKTQRKLQQLTAPTPEND